MSEPFSKVSSISDEYEYSNIRITLPLNIIPICICAISGIQIYLDICLVNVWHQNIFGYSFGTLCGIQIFSYICLSPFYEICSSLAPIIPDPPPTNFTTMHSRLVRSDRHLCHGSTAYFPKKNALTFEPII